jgi:hypothetical protein
VLKHDTVEQVVLCDIDEVRTLRLTVGVDAYYFALGCYPCFEAVPSPHV